MKLKGWDGDEDTNKIQWSFSGALFYSIIVITTIGEYINKSYIECICKILKNKLQIIIREFFELIISSNYINILKNFLVSRCTI